MRKALAVIFPLAVALIVLSQCKKNNNSYTPSAFADSLRAECTQPFSGTGDSSNGFHLATAFTPNGDGINDVYRIIGYPADLATFSMLIYDTTGTLIFKTANPANYWFGQDSLTGKITTQYKFYVKVKYTTTGNKTDSGSTYVYLLSTSSSGCINDVKADSSSYEFEDQFNLATGLFDPANSSNENFCN